MEYKRRRRGRSRYHGQLSINIDGMLQDPDGFTCMLAWGHGAGASRFLELWKLTCGFINSFELNRSSGKNRWKERALSEAKDLFSKIMEYQAKDISQPPTQPPTPTDEKYERSDSGRKSSISTESGILTTPAAWGKAVPAELFKELTDALGSENIYAFETSSRILKHHLHNKIATTWAKFRLSREFDGYKKRIQVRNQRDKKIKVHITLLSAQNLDGKGRNSTLRMYPTCSITLADTSPNENHSVITSQASIGSYPMWDPAVKYTFEVSSLASGEIQIFILDEKDNSKLYGFSNVKLQEFQRSSRFITDLELWLSRQHGKRVPGFLRVLLEAEVPPGEKQPAFSCGLSNNPNAISKGSPLSASPMISPQPELSPDHTPARSPPPYNFPPTSSLSSSRFPSPYLQPSSPFKELVRPIPLKIDFGTSVQEGVIGSPERHVPIEGVTKGGGGDEVTRKKSSEKSPVTQGTVCGSDMSSLKSPPTQYHPLVSPQSVKYKVKEINTPSPNMSIGEKKGAGLQMPSIARSRSTLMASHEALKPKQSPESECKSLSRSAASSPVSETTSKRNAWLGVLTRMRNEITSSSNIAPSPGNLLDDVERRNIIDFSSNLKALFKDQTNLHNLIRFRNRAYNIEMMKLWQTLNDLHLTALRLRDNRVDLAKALKDSHCPTSTIPSSTSSSQASMARGSASSFDLKSKTKSTPRLFDVKSKEVDKDPMTVIRRHLKAQRRKLKKSSFDAYEMGKSEINISQKQNEKWEDALKRGRVPEILKAMQSVTQEVYDMVERDSFRRFKLSKLWADCKKAAMLSPLRNLKSFPLHVEVDSGIGFPTSEDGSPETEYSCAVYVVDSETLGNGAGSRRGSGKLAIDEDRKIRDIHSRRHTVGGGLLTGSLKFGEEKDERSSSQSRRGSGRAKMKSSAVYKTKWVRKPLAWRERFLIPAVTFNHTLVLTVHSRTVKKRKLLSLEFKVGKAQMNIENLAFNPRVSRSLVVKSDKQQMNRSGARQKVLVKLAIDTKAITAIFPNVSFRVSTPILQSRKSSPPSTAILSRSNGRVVRRRSKSSRRSSIEPHS
ncbi:hypothetical protein AAMO2058_000007800 [Amorphochlora amoebiformis]